MKKTGLVVLALLAGSAAHAQPADPVAGEDAFVTDCVRCHASAARIMRKIGGDTADEKSAWLDEFLQDHHVSDPDSKVHLIAYLVGL